MKMMEKEIKIIRSEFLKDIKKINNLSHYQDIYKNYFGKKGKFFYLLLKFRKLSISEKKEAGREINELKIFLQRQLVKIEEKLQSQQNQSKKSKLFFDFTEPTLTLETGSLHPITIVINEVEKIFKSMGFNITRSFEVETEWYNFDALNIPSDHPARDAWDTFWLDKELIDIKDGSKKLLRTHTSPAQIRYMKKHNPPLRMITVGKVFRHEATDSSHGFQFYQLEGLMVDKDISVAHLKNIIKQFLQIFFNNKKIKIRIRPGYFPFVEPGFEVDLECFACHGDFCQICKNKRWIELVGAGMVHPNVFRAVDYDSQQWRGFAFGWGLDRLTMIKYGIDDIRLFHSNDLRFLKQF